MNFCVMPFEHCNGPSTFQQLIELVFVGLSGSCYMMHLDDWEKFHREFGKLTGNFGRFHQANLKSVSWLANMVCILAVISRDS